MSMTPQRFIQQHPGCRKLQGRWHNFSLFVIKREEKDTEGNQQITDLRNMSINWQFMDPNMNKLFKKYNYEAIKAIQILTGYLKNYH